jgi:hypothetical protein
MSVRCKFRCHSVHKNMTDKYEKGTDGMYHPVPGVQVQGSENIRLTPVYSDDPTSENKKYWDATPSGELTMCITNPGAFGQFEEGNEYYLDITLATGNT